MCSERELASLRFHWGGAYSISFHLGTWIAARADTREILQASSAGELRDKIRADYSARPVPRQLEQHAG
jgi:hypothetical protein